MSQENVELAYRAYDAVNRRDLDGYLALMDDEVKAVSFLVAMEGEYQGHAGIRRWWRNLLDVFPDFNVELVEVRDLGGDSVLATVHWGGHGAGSGTPIDMLIWMAVRMRDGKCVWWQAFGDKDEALEAVGGCVESRSGGKAYLREEVLEVDIQPAEGEAESPSTPDDSQATPGENSEAG